MNPQEKAILKAIYDIVFEYPELIETWQFRKALFENTIKIVNEKHKDIPNYMDYILYTGSNLYLNFNPDFMLSLTSDVAREAKFIRFTTTEFKRKNPEIYDPVTSKMKYLNSVPEEIKISYRNNPQRWNVAFAKVNRGNVNITEYISKCNNRDSNNIVNKDNNNIIAKFYKYYWMILFQFFSKLADENKIFMFDVYRDILNIKYRKDNADVTSSGDNNKENIQNYNIENNIEIEKLYLEFCNHFHIKIKILSVYHVKMEKSIFNNLICGNYNVKELFTTIINNKGHILYSILENRRRIYNTLGLFGTVYIIYKFWNK